MDNISLRDFFAAHIMAGKVNTLYSQAHREQTENGEWVQVSAEEATENAIRNAAENAYKIADALLLARERK